MDNCDFIHKTLSLFLCNITLTFRVFSISRVHGVSRLSFNSNNSFFFFRLAFIHTANHHHESLIEQSTFRKTHSNTFLLIRLYREMKHICRPLSSFFITLMLLMFVCQLTLLHFFQSFLFALVETICLGLFWSLSIDLSTLPPTSSLDEERSCEDIASRGEMIRYCFQIKSDFYVKMKCDAIIEKKLYFVLFTAMNIYEGFERRRADGVDHRRCLLI